MDHFKEIPVYVFYTFIAAAGGVARYLNSYTQGTKFSLSIFIASAFAAGFSGMMFALLGDSMSMPSPVPYIMAGVGGFFGDQTMKFLLEYFTKNKVSK